jgi:cytochrome c556
VRRTATLLALPIILLQAGPICAGAPLKSAMRTWKADAATLDRMSTSGAIDGSEAARLLADLSAGSQALASNVRGTSAEARDLKARFVRFAADAQSTSDAVRTNDKANIRYGQLRAQCRSCHRLYN